MPMWTDCAMSASWATIWRRICSLTVRRRGARLLNSVNYNVVGVLEPKGAASGGQEDNFAIIPVTTAINRYEEKNWLDLIILGAGAQRRRLR